MLRTTRIKTAGAGLHLITDAVRSVVRDSGTREGLCTVFIQHTSASLLIQEHDGPSARRDLECWLARLVPEGDPLYTHVAEGSDDMPAHIKSALTCTSVSIPIVQGALALGRWQAVYLWEHRRNRDSRDLIIHVGE